MMTDSYKIYRMNDCKNCERAAFCLMASRGKPGPAQGEMQHCPECGDRRFVVFDLVSVMRGSALEMPAFMREPTTFTVPIGYEMLTCDCGRTPDYSHTEYIKGGAKLSVYHCDHGGKADQVGTLHAATKKDATPEAHDGHPMGRIPPLATATGGVAGE